MMSFRTLLVVGVLLLAIQLVHGHGYMKVPKSRQYIANLQSKEFCPQCYSSGGPSVVQAATPGGLFPTPTETAASAVRHTMCGDAVTTPVSARLYNPFTSPAASALPTYKPGQVMDIVVTITAHHRGHFEFRICDAAKLSDPRTVTWACADQNVLKRVSVPGEVSPVDVNHPERYYLEPECAPGYNTTITMKYQIPSTLTCERCIMQWWWVSANSCNPPDYAKRSPMPAASSSCQWWQPNLATCGQAYPEEFWNCADIRIAGTASPGANSVPPPTRPAAPAPRPVTQPTRPAPVRPAPVRPAPARPTPNRPTSPTKGCAVLGGQCGGQGWTGPKCCPSGSTCMAYLTTYSQCRQGSCPAGWLCQRRGRDNESEKTMLEEVVDTAKSLFE